MGEHQKIAGEFPRLELAQHLETLAKKLRLGKVRLRDQEFQMPELLTAQIKLKEKDGQIKVKLSLAFPVQAAPDAAAVAAQERRQMSFKEVKKQLGAVFGELLKAATSGALPQESRIEAFLKLSREFARQADPAWAQEIQEFLDHVENLRLAFQNRQADMFQHELRDLQNRMKICHRDFK
jgi:XXXCH domain-containing protein